MTRHWNVAHNYIEIAQMPFYWRLSHVFESDPDVASILPIRVVVDSKYDYLKYEPNENEWGNIDRAYQKNETIGFVNPDSGQLQTYGSSVNDFFLNSIIKYQPDFIYEIGCGAGFSIKFLQDNGWGVIGIDPSEYSLTWSIRLNFKLINGFFNERMLSCTADFIYCNDVFEHVREIEKFSKLVYESLANNGVFCFATTNSTQSIAIGDISMFEHQHVNMFTERSIHLILQVAGFSDIDIQKGAYGNTFHVIACKNPDGLETPLPLTDIRCDGYFDRASKKIEAFSKFYAESENLCCYVPLRSIPYLATVGDFGRCPIYDSNESWRGKFVDGYDSLIRSKKDVEFSSNTRFFVGSLTFYQEIKSMLIEKGFSSADIFSIEELL